MKLEALDTAYFTLVEPLIRRSLEDRLRYPVNRQMEQGAAAMSSKGNGKLTVESFQVESLTAGKEAVSLSFHFGLSLKP